MEMKILFSLYKCLIEKNKVRMEWRVGMIMKIKYGFNSIREGGNKNRKLLWVFFSKLFVFIVYQLFASLSPPILLSCLSTS